MKLSNVIKEDEFKKRYLLWQHKNNNYPVLTPGYTVDDFLQTMPMPHIEYTHYKSIADENGDLITVLRGNFHLDSWQTKNRKHDVDFEFYHLIKTLTDSPEVEPFPMGYIIVKE